MTDLELIADVKKGSRSSQEILVRRHYKLVYSFLYRMMGGSNSFSIHLPRKIFDKEEADCIMGSLLRGLTSIVLSGGEFFRSHTAHFYSVFHNHQII
ncbi:hypothetical protein ABE288_08910 [Bacillus salipaludis]|uniref:RNA polymerase sigma factor n=1 Tax=Bacillus salipaludis TaxID=2547811 RepID=UPI003D1C048C